MTPLRSWFPLIAAASLAGLALLYGPIAQPPNYNDFADRQTVFGIPHCADVVSNLGFALVALWGWFQLAPARQSPAIRNGWAGYRMFLIGLFFTAVGSSYYHLDPDNVRLVWDRLPIALACGGLLAGVWGDCRSRDSGKMAAGLALAAVLSVAWWHFGEQAGSGDLRPYLLLQALPIVLVPLWQWIHDRPRGERWAFAAAFMLYIAAKFAELGDHQIAAAVGVLTGHTLKHLLSTCSALLIVACLVRRVRIDLRKIDATPATKASTTIPRNFNH